MSEVTKTNEPVKQEGEFSLKGKKTKPKQLTKKDNEVKKVVISPKEPLLEVEDNVKKVEIKKEENAIQIGETEEVSVEEPSGDSAKVGEPIQESNEDVEGFSPIKEVTEAEVKEVEARSKRSY